MSKIQNDCRDKFESMTYTDMLRIWRFSPAGNPVLQGESGDIFEKVFFRKKTDIGDNEATRISKLVGWN